MQRYVAFLRGMNLGKRRLAMSELKALFEKLDFAEVETFIASGNVLFSSPKKKTSQLEAQIAAHLEKSLGYRVDTFIRTTAEVAAIGKGKVFRDEGKPGVTVHVGFLHEKLPAEVARELAAVRTAEDSFRVADREYYWLCRVRTSESRVWASSEIKALRLPTSSMRNMTSIRKLIAKHIA